jgi:polyisoprenoid-binding protein YceI
MQATKWTLDPTHSELGFKIKHLMITNVTGYFKKFEVTAETPTGNFADAKIKTKIEVESISTNNAQRDEHLRTADFFQVDQYPYIEFESTNVEQVDDETFNITGNLTIKNTTKPVKVVAEYHGTTTDPWGNTKAGFELNGKITRKDFGINYNATLETGGVLLGEDLKLTGEIQLVKQAELQPA